MQGTIKEPAMTANCCHSVARLSWAVPVCLYGLLVVNLPDAQAATYYVTTAGNDNISCSNATNASTPRRTINAGKNCLTSPGDTLMVGDGTYVEDAIDMRVSGTSTAPITIKAQNKLQAILSSRSGTTCAPNISFNASYIVIDGLRGVIDPSDPYCTPNSATGLFVRMWNSNTPTLGGNTSTGYMGGVVRNCQVDYHRNRSVGIKTNQDNSLVENCIMHSSLEAFNGVNQVFRNNYVDAPDAWGMYFSSKGGARNTQVYNNVIRVNSNWGGLVLGGNSSCCWWDANTHIEGYNQVAYNNVVIIDGGNGNGALSFVGTKNSAVINNVVINGNISMSIGSQGCCSPQPWPDGSVIKNNILSSDGAACTYSWGSDTNRTVDYNDFYNCGGVPSQAHPIAGNPIFVDPLSNWNLQTGSPALGSGAQASFTGYSGELIDVSKDKNSVTRIVPWSLGIYAGESNVTPPAPPRGLLVR